RGFEEGVVIGQFEHLLVSRCRQFFAAIAHIHAPEAGHAVEDAVSLAVKDRAAFGAGDDAAAAYLGDEFVIGLRGQVMFDIKLAQGGDVVIAARAHAGSLFVIFSPRSARPMSLKNICDCGLPSGRHSGCHCTAMTGAPFTSAETASMTPS